MKHQAKKPMFGLPNTMKDMINEYANLEGPPTYV
jgi:hypothetical protein